MQLQTHGPTAAFRRLSAEHPFDFGREALPSAAEPYFFLTTGFFADGDFGFD